MRFSTLTASLVVVLVSSTAACWPRGKGLEESQLDAISAASKRLFGTNVRGYMWALTTDSPALFAQAPTALGGSSGGTAYDPFAMPSDGQGRGAPQTVNASPMTSVAPLPGRKILPVTKLDPLNSPLFQCWYYAETPVYVRLDGEGLRKLFLDKTKTKKINNNFIDVRNLGTELSRSETFRHFESFALSALPGTCFLFSAVGPLKGKAKGALTNAMCSISLASLSGLRKVSGDGWGSDKARVQIQNQLKARVDELEEVNWDVLSTLKNKVAEYNSAERYAETTQVQCPLNEAWVAELMGPH